MHADEAAGEGEGVDVRVIDHEELETLAAVIGLGGDAAADFIDVLGDQRILDDRAALAELRHDRAANLGLFRLGQHRVGRAAHVRQLDVVRARAARNHEQ